MGGQIPSMAGSYLFRSSHPHGDYTMQVNHVGNQLLGRIQRHYGYTDGYTRRKSHKIKSCSFEGVIDMDDSRDVWEKLDSDLGVDNMALVFKFKYTERCL